MTEPTTEKFDEWAILELMGHRRLAGKVTEVAIGGGSFLRIDMPMKNGTNSTQFYSPGAIYCITPTTKEIAEEMSRAYQPEPINQWEFKQLFEHNKDYIAAHGSISGSPDGMDMSEEEDEGPHGTALGDDPRIDSDDPTSLNQFHPAH